MISNILIIIQFKRVSNFYYYFYFKPQVTQVHDLVSTQMEGLLLCLWFWFLVQFYHAQWWCSHYYKMFFFIISLPFGYEYNHSSFLYWGIFWLVFAYLFSCVALWRSCIFFFNLKIMVFKFQCLFYLHLISLQYMCLFLYIVIYHSICTSFPFLNLILCLFGEVFFFFNAISSHPLYLSGGYTFACYPRCYKVNPCIIEV